MFHNAICVLGIKVEANGKSLTLKVPQRCFRHQDRTTLSTHSVKHSLLEHALGPSSSVPPSPSSFSFHPELPYASLSYRPISSLHTYSAGRAETGARPGHIGSLQEGHYALSMGWKKTSAGK